MCHILTFQFNVSLGLLTSPVNETETDRLRAVSWTWTDTRFPLVQNLDSFIFQSGHESRDGTVWEETGGKG